MEILHVISSLGQGGAEKLVSDLVSHSHKKIDVLILDNSLGKHGEKLQQRGINVIKPLCKRNFVSLSNFFFLHKHIKKYDVIHAHLFHCLYWVALLSLFVPKIYVYTEHNTNNKRRKHILFRPIEWFIYSRYNCIICISNAVAANLKLWLGVDWQKIKVIHNGIYLGTYKNAIKYNKSDFPNCNNDDILLVMVARFAASKDQPTLIKALSLLPDTCKLLLVGDGEREKEYKELVDRLHLTGRVVFLGFRQDVSSILRTADIGVLSSHWDGFGLVAVEYMAAGCPVVASDVDGLCDVVKDAGLLFEAGNVNDLREKLELLINDPIKYKFIAEACLQRSHEFGIEKMIDNYLKVYEKIIHSS
ncbi:glycosyl transferase [Bacteroidia bacterium]|nr:glycosyl transferase [Bacteroidia bacterium]